MKVSSFAISAVILAANYSAAVLADNRSSEPHSLLRMEADPSVYMDSGKTVVVEESTRRLQTTTQGDFLDKLLSLLLPVLLPILNDPCPLLEQQFIADAEVTCTCAGSLLFNVNFACSYKEICGGDGILCATPTYSGQISLLTTTSVNTICMSDMNFLQGRVPLPADNNDLCVTIKFDPNTSAILDCEANLLGLPCLRCIPCVGGGGIRLTCGGTNASQSQCLDVGGLISRPSDVDNEVKPFFFLDIFSGITGKKGN